MVVSVVAFSEEDALVVFVEFVAVVFVALELEFGELEEDEEFAVVEVAEPELLSLAVVVEVADPELFVDEDVADVFSEEDEELDSETELPLVSDEEDEVSVVFSLESLDVEEEVSVSVEEAVSSSDEETEEISIPSSHETASAEISCASSISCFALYSSSSPSSSTKYPLNLWSRQVKSAKVELKTFPTSVKTLSFKT